MKDRIGNKINLLAAEFVNPKLIQSLKSNNRMTAKRLGQNFLSDIEILESIVESGEISADDTVVEIGAGTGLLTEQLAKTGAKIIAVEKDRNLIPVLENKFENQKNVTIIEKDILKFVSESYKLQVASYKIVGNIPYYLTSRLIRLISEEWPKPKLILLMVQKEVAERIVALPPKMSLLTLAVQLYAKAQIIRDVPRHNFHPVPKVDSALIKILPREKNLLSEEDAKNFFKLIHAGFGSKRKQLANSLSDNLKIPKDSVVKTLTEAEIKPERRAETLTLNEWLKLNQKKLLRQAI